MSGAHAHPLSPVAQRDILDITDYYTELSRRLGERFTEELTSTLRSLTRQPGMGSQRYAASSAGSLAADVAAGSFPLPSLLSCAR
jgi:plasmid stabilization system protein ParE